MKCQYCKGNCIKKGCYKRRQLYQCKNCKKYQRTTYVKPKIQETKKNQIKLYHNEGLGISSISRILTISKSSVQRKLTELAKQQPKPVIQETQQSL
ncbi:MAG: IS1 family transposase [Bacteroidetes bacterium]|nr:MAG: IS1 family transposase [Bacteroidota bacterium]